LWQGKNPVRVLIDPMLQVQGDGKIFNADARTLVFNRLETRNIFNVDRIQLDFSENILPKILEYLHFEGIQSLIVEGGSDTLSRFIHAGLWDEVRRFTSKKEITDGLKAPIIEDKAQVSFPVEEDLLDIFYTLSS
jgi:diaminohydroxyphosphoribosylaminopyrimidine deaminase/5-amino-6-(5-phosphoribosylamino)uracil reductase